MTENPKMNWSASYRQHIDRNIGLLKEEQQEKLRTSKVAVLGLGGLGSPCFEVLVRSGIGSFSVVDRDIYEPTNLNRQIFAFHSTVGKKKTDVAQQFALDINPDAEISKFDTVTEDNVSEVLHNVDAIVMAIDDVKPCIIVSRKSRAIPIVEGWGAPFCTVRVIAETTPSLEELYNLSTQGRPVNEISDKEFKKLNLEVLMKLGEIEGIADYYLDPEDIISTGRAPTLGPLVWLCSIFMAFETVKVLLNWGDIAYGPDWFLYNPFGRQVIEKS